MAKMAPVERDTLCSGFTAMKPSRTPLTIGKPKEWAAEGMVETVERCGSQCKEMADKTEDIQPDIFIDDRDRVQVQDSEPGERCSEDEE
ncbi:hypothetical protein NQZ68_002836 [Dissostichus eleginoides]|nr:hypothetical protein NQZ68_002836 [Dissostichus eleginoides]